ncbi:MAG: PolC-type DNA polymerase III, partial [Lachnospiraceae bacterium]|nr:PolC-type DNA polymerase III [Lachnospiraceae bacterium]
MKQLLDVFSNLSAEDKAVGIFADCFVDAVSVKKSLGQVLVKLTSEERIRPVHYALLEQKLKEKYFYDTNLSVRLSVSYPQDSGRLLSDVWDELRYYVLEAIRIRDHLDGVILDEAAYTCEDNNLTVSLSDHSVSRCRKQNMITVLTETIEEMTGTMPVIIFDYVRDEEEFEPEGEPVLTVEEFLERTRLQALKAEEKNSRNRKPKDLEPPKKKEDLKEAEKTDKPKKHAPTDPDIFYGRSFTVDRVLQIRDIQDEIGDVVISGQICSYEDRLLKSGDRYLIVFSVTDFTDTINVKLFVKKENLGEVKPDLQPGKFVMLRGSAQYDKFDREIGIGSVIGVKRYKDTRIKRTDSASFKRVELHAHTQMSDMDAVTDVKKLVKRAFEWGHPAIAITDHGVVQSFVDAFHAIDPKKLGDDPEIQERFKKFKIIYGCEGYIVDDEAVTKEDGSPLDLEEDKDAIRKLPYYHIILLAKNDIGRVNLYRLVSLSHLEYFYPTKTGRPRIPKSLLRKYREGIIVGSAYEQGELFRALITEKPAEELRRIRDFYDYYEIQPIGNNEFLIHDEKFPKITSERDLENLNKQIVQMADEDGKLCVATCDVHFLNPEDEIYRRIIMAGKGFADADRQPPLYFRTTEEMLAEFSYLSPAKAYQVVVENTNKVNDMIERIKPVRPDKCPPFIENSDRDLRDICYNTAHSMYGENLPHQVSERLEKELTSIISNGFAVMYIIAQRLVKHSNDDGYMVGSRGSVGSSFVATMAGITEVNPLPAHYYCPNCHYYDFDSEEVKAFAQKSGFDMPDKKCPVCGTPLKKDGQNIPFETFLGFKGDKEPDIDLNFSGDNQSEAHAYTEVLFGKGYTFRAGTVASVAENTAFGFIKKYYEDRGIHKRSAEISRLIQGTAGVKRSTGQHPGGIVVLPHGEEIYSFTPVQKPANDNDTDTITTHFDYHKIDHNLLKLDILGHDDPTMVRFLEDLTGVPAKSIPMDDPKVVSLFASTEALGITPDDLDGCDLGSLGLPELGTEFVMQMLRDTKPQSFSDMIRISGLSHGTDVWLNNTQTLIEEKKCTLSNAICTRDDIMTYLISMGVENSLSFKIMESVRKGKGLTPEMEDAMKEKNVPDWYLWSCKRIKYMFPKAHACAYVMMAFRIAYCKVYYPLAYYAAYFSIRAKAFSYELMCMGKEELNNQLRILKQKSNSSEKLSDKDENLMYVMRICQEMYARGYEFHKLDIYRAKAMRFQILDGKLMPSLLSIDGL